MRRLVAHLAALAALGAAFCAPATAGAAVVNRGTDIDVVYGETVADATADVDAAAALGSNMIRLTVQWQALQPLDRAHYAPWYLDRLDAIVARARERSIKVLVTAAFSPCWASSAPNAADQCLDRSYPAYKTAPPTDPADYGALVAFLARRWAGALGGIEVWNEPNLPQFFTSADPPKDYATLVRAARVALRAADPGLPLVAGAVGGPDVAFIDALRAQHLDGQYDALSVHAYNDGRPPEQFLPPQFARSTYLQGLLALRAAMGAWHDSTPVWITELGWNTSTLRGATWLDGVTEAQQADYLSRALAMLDDPASGIDYPVTALVYRLRDVADNPADPQANYGLQHKDHAAKPSFAAVQAAFAALAVGRPRDVVTSAGVPAGQDTGAPALAIPATATSTPFASRTAAAPTSAVTRRSAAHKTARKADRTTSRKHRRASRKHHKSTAKHRGSHRRHRASATARRTKKPGSRRASRHAPTRNRT